VGRRFPTLIIASGYLLGCIPLIPGSILFYPTFSSDPTLYKIGVSLFIVGCFLLLCAAFFKITTINNSLLCSGTQRPNDTEGSLLEPLHNQAPRTDHIQTILSSHFPAYFNLLGGALFFGGAAAFWPSFQTSLIGNWLFRCGSLSYITASSLGIHFLRKNPPLDIWSLLAYCLFILGALCYLTGGVLFLPYFIGEIYGVVASIAWTVGSVFFVGGSLVGFLQTVGCSLVQNKTEHNKAEVINYGGTE